MDDPFYRQHLAQLNDSNPVKATEDIKNAQGQLLLRAGHVLDQTSIDKIVKFKLLKPIETCIALENQLTAQGLYDTIESFFCSDPSGVVLWENANDEVLLMDCCQRAGSYSLLMQKMTVLADRLPRLHRKALFGAWCAQRIFAINGESVERIYEAFIAGLVHDVGKLHLNPDYIESRRKLEPEEWRQLQAHPLISYQVVRNIPGLSAEICQAVRDHHESVDGTGYPANKVASAIGSLAQILHLLDSTFAIYERNFKPKKKSLSDLIPIIQVSQHYRFNPKASALVVLLKHIPHTGTAYTPDRFFGDLVEYVEKKNHYIIEFVALASELNRAVGYNHNNKKLIGLQNILLHIHITMARSGLIDSTYADWLSQAGEADLTDTACREVEDVSLMLLEMLHHCEKFKVQMQLYLESDKEQPFIGDIADINQRLNALVVPTPGDRLSDFMQEVVVT